MIEKRKRVMKSWYNIDSIYYIYLFIYTICYIFFSKHSLSDYVIRTRFARFYQMDSNFRYVMVSRLTNRYHLIIQITYKIELFNESWIFNYFFIVVLISNPEFLINNISVYFIKMSFLHMNNINDLTFSWIFGYLIYNLPHNNIFVFW